MPQQTKIEGIEKIINNLKGVIGVIRIAEIINKFAPTPEDRMIIFDYFYKVLDKEITVKEFAQNLLQKLSIKQEDKRQLILGINGKIFHYLEDYLKKEISAPLFQKGIQGPGPEFEEMPKQAAPPKLLRPEMPRQVLRPEIPIPQMPRPAPRPEIPKPEMPGQASRPEISRLETPRQVFRPEIPRPEIPAPKIQRPEMPKREPMPFQRPERPIQRPALGQDRYREPVPEASQRASEKSEPKIQGNIVDLRNQ